MLILTRRVGEGLFIGDQIRLVVLEIRGRQIRLGIDAPPDIVVLRQEVYERLVQDNLAATRVVFNDLLELSQALGRRPAAQALLGHVGAAGFIVHSDQLGEIRVPEKQIIDFPAGLPGVAGSRRLALIWDPRTAPLGFLQSLEDPAIGFAVAESEAVAPGFRLPPMYSAQKELGAAGPGEVLVLVPLTVPSEQPAGATANLVSPILINLRTRQGKQLFMENLGGHTPKQRLLPE